jgi:putative addiction module component (TIGR02574 family)
MGEISFADILKLTVAERIQLAEDIWDSIAGAPGSVELTDAQRAELARRFEEFRKNPQLGSPWEDVRKRIIQPR